MTDDLLNSKPCIIIILVGLPASGKSTLASKLQNYFQNSSLSFSPPNSSSPILLDPNSNNVKVQHIDTDTIRSQIFNQNFDPLKEEQVLQQKRILIHDSIAKNSIIIIDDMHYYVSMRHEIFQLAKETHSLYISIATETPIEICLEWNEKRGFPIPNSVITNVAGKFDPMGLKYRWDRPNFVIDLSKGDKNTEIMQICQSILKKWRQFIIDSTISPEKPSNSISNIQSTKDLYQQWDRLSRKMISFIMTDTQYNPLVQEINDYLNRRLQLTKNSSLGIILSEARKKYCQWLKLDSSRGDPIENLITMIQSFHEFLKHEN